MAENFEGNPASLYWYVHQVMNGRVGVEDFTFHWHVQAACNGFDATQLVKGGKGYLDWDSDHAYLFVDNSDTDTSPGQQVVFNKLLAYAWMLTMPCKMAIVYGKDYFPSGVWPGAYGLQKWIDNMVWINRMFAFGATQVRYLDKNVAVVTRDGNGGALGWSGGLLTALNFDTYNWQHPYVQTTFGGNQWIHDYTGNGPDLRTDGNGGVQLALRPNAFSSGLSYSMYSKGGVNQPIHVNSYATAQTFFGAADLDIGPVVSGVKSIGKVWCAKNKPISLLLTANRTGWQEMSSIEVQVLAPSDVNAVGCHLGTGGPSASGESVTTESGWHSLVFIGNLLPTDGSSFELKVTYTGGPL
jgi:alpha-amylase